MSQQINAVIVEDEVTNQNVLQSLLKQYCPDVNVTKVSSTYKEAIEDITAQSPNLVFLDIKLDHNYTAFDMLDQLNELNFFIVFITAYDEFIKKAINEVDALFYITKPIKISELEKAVEKVKLKLAEGQAPNQDAQTLKSIKTIVNPLNKIMLPTKNGYEFLNVTDIIRIQALGNYVQVFSVNNKRYTVYQKLSYYEDRLKEYNILRVHRSHLVNLAFVNKFNKVGRGGVVMMTDNSKVQIAPGYRQTFIDMF